MCHYLDFLHDATAAAAENGFRTHLLVAPLPQLQQCEPLTLNPMQPIYSGKKVAVAAAPCEQTFNVETGFSLFF